MKKVIQGEDTKTTINTMLAAVKDTHGTWVCVDALVQHGTAQLYQVTLEDMPSKPLLSGSEAVTTSHPEEKPSGLGALFS